MLVAESALGALREGLAGGGGYRFASVPVDFHPRELVRAAARLYTTAQYFSTPDGRASAGLGVAWRQRPSGSERFARLGDLLGTAPVPGGRRLFFGFSFNADGPHSDAWGGFGPCEVILPRVAVHFDGAACRLDVVLPPGIDAAPTLELLSRLHPPGPPQPPDADTHSITSHPSPAAWRDEVAEAIAAIRAGSLEKVVLCRSVVLTAQRPAEPFDVLALLEAAYPQCYAFGWQSGEATFVGASPELLLAKEGPQVELNPLAGSAPRGEGEDEDRWLGEALMASAKDRREHAIVVADIAARLEGLTEVLEVPRRPSLRRMATVQHLSTEIRGRLEPGRSALDVLEILHPTPAVGGTPRPAAVNFIDKVEGLDRGWYTGGIGWLTPDGDATVALSLRCGLMRGEQTTLYAGAGIVADSDPDAELVETRLKFRPLLEILAAT